jgi:hypothetical protein
MLGVIVEAYFGSEVRRALLPAQPGRVGEADEDEITAPHGFSGISSYSSISSHPARRPASHAKA